MCEFVVMKLLTKEVGLPEFLNIFSTDKKCRKYLELIRWNGKPVCPHCASIKTPYVIEGGERYKCGENGCGCKFSSTSGTLFDNTKTPLRIWMYLIYSQDIDKKNSSSHQTARNLGLTQRASWNINHKIRSILFQDKNLRLSGVIEVDECFVGSTVGRNSYYKRMSRKETILGIIQRGGKVIIKHVPDRKSSTMESVIREHVSDGATVYTDGCRGYRGLGKWFDYDWVNHSAREWVNGSVHTNNIESVWRRFKASIRQHHQVSAKHVQLYCDEMAYRHNTSRLKNLERFHDMLSRALNSTPKKYIKKSVLLKDGNGDCN